ncbi:MAG: hypothetical protein PHG19_06205 [Anaerotignum sp.]|nr:hypothetical protein [Anaerotignum sp.]
MNQDEISEKLVEVEALSKSNQHRMDAMGKHSRTGDYRCGWCSGWISLEWRYVFVRRIRKYFLNEW